jgi:hypothetical protein
MTTSHGISIPLPRICTKHRRYIIPRDTDTSYGFQFEDTEPKQTRHKTTRRAQTAPPKQDETIHQRLYRKGKPTTLSFFTFSTSLTGIHTPYIPGSHPVLGWECPGLSHFISFLVNKLRSTTLFSFPSLLFYKCHLRMGKHEPHRSRVAWGRPQEPAPEELEYFCLFLLYHHGYYY